MNESGPSCAALAHKQGVEADRLIAVYDELDIPAGELRVKLGGGSSHNGVRNRCSRRLGPGTSCTCGSASAARPGVRTRPDFVLAPIGKKLEADIAIWVDHAADAVRSLIAEGLAPTQDRFNRQAPPADTQPAGSARAPLARR